MIPFIGLKCSTAGSMRIIVQQSSLFLLFLIISKGTYSQEFTYAQNRIIDKKTDSIIRLYETYAGLTDAGTYIYKPYVDKLKKLFKPGVYIYNDIEPGKKHADTMITVDKYCSNIQRWYKQGLVIELTNIDKGEIIPSDGVDYTKIVSANKEVGGAHNSRGYHEEKNAILFKIAFKKEGHDFTDFKISGINSLRQPGDAVIPPDVIVTVPLANAEQEDNTSAFFIAVHYMNTSSKISIKNVPEQDGTAISNVSENRESGYNIGSAVSYYITNSLSVGTGIEISHYKTLFNISSYESSYNATDIDNDSYERLVYATDIEEFVELTYLDLPLAVKYENIMPNNIGYYLSIGAQFSFALSSSYQATGIASYEGYYSDYNITLVDLPEYGFYSANRFEIDDKLAVKPVNVSAFLSFGAQIPLNNNINLNLGPFLIVGLSNISKYDASDYRLSNDIEDYNSLIGTGTRAVTRAIGFKIRLSYRLSK